MHPAARHPDPRAAALGAGAVAELAAAVADEAARAPGCAAQFALARRGVLGAAASSGRAATPSGERPAGPDMLFSAFSVTKALTASAVWILLDEGALDPHRRAAEWIPELGRDGKRAITIEHLLTHCAGLPGARFDPLEWSDREGRVARFAAWRLEWPPGSRFVYHGSSAMWLLAELIERAAGCDYRAFIRERITTPLGLSDLHLGLPPGARERVARVVAVGEPAAGGAGPAPVDAPALEDEMIASANRPDVQAAGSPGGGAIATAASIAMFYQALLADWRGEGPGIWSGAVLEEAFRVHSADFVDPMTRQPALRGLGVVVAGGDGAIWRGFPPGCSARSIGHMGAGGQIAWADPESGLSFCYLTNGAERDPVRQGARGLELSSLAARCPAPLPRSARGC